ncbi:glutamate synthase central domain-containing protein, partial [Staphylococcus pasteuri_A]
MRDQAIIDSSMSNDDVISRYSNAVNSGLLKIFSKMGISTLQSYQGAQIFEALGINSDVVKKYFTGTVTRIEGLSLDGIA